MIRTPRGIRKQGAGTGVPYHPDQKGGGKTFRGTSGEGTTQGRELGRDLGNFTANARNGWGMANKVSPLVPNPLGKRKGNMININKGSRRVRTRRGIRHLVGQSICINTVLATGNWMHPPHGMGSSGVKVPLRLGSITTYTPHL